MAASKEPDFEKQMKRLQEVVEALEKDELSLEKNLALYKEGIGLVRFCRQRLEKARHTVKILEGEEFVNFSDLEEEER